MKSNAKSKFLKIFVSIFRGERENFQKLIDAVCESNILSDLRITKQELTHFKYANCQLLLLYSLHI